MTSLGIYPIEPKDYIEFDEVLHPTPFQCVIEVKDEHTSTEINHINNIEYLRWIDKAAQLHCDAFGWERSKLLDSGVMWFVARHEIDYRAEASTNDCLRLTTWVDDVRKVKSWRSTYIHAHGVKPKVICHCKTLWVLVDLQTRKPTSVPADMANALQPLQPPRGIQEAAS